MHIPLNIGCVLAEMQSLHSLPGDAMNPADRVFFHARLEEAHDGTGQHDARYDEKAIVPPRRGQEYDGQAG